jgi:hypothetical protein
VTFTLPAAARRMGHGAQLQLRTRAHVIDVLGDTRYADLDALIRPRGCGSPWVPKEPRRAAEPGSVSDEKARICAPFL